ncbi:hypothetical protein N7456_006824 [Penicillium angulare]|uniref:Zn(2)-C6 fungal-type domain-containing protein n=1 Tax=Penicillium angulare TaxID=116970 RepID=A0A9W9KD94_9EURO|nr:hypothetical protein N7456_006824 [Penicillium angulare]
MSVREFLGITAQSVWSESIPQIRSEACCESRVRTALAIRKTASGLISSGMFDYIVQMTAKLPIPRLPRGRRDTGGRTAQACETCRERKCKCDGVRPTCSQCLAQGLGNCFYPERKVVQQQKTIDSMRSELKYYQELLRNLSQESKGPIANRVTKAHGQEKTGRDAAPSSSSESLFSFEQDEVANEDFNRNETSRATGFMGNSSEVAWMHHLNLQFPKQKDQGPVVDISSSNYHVDHQAMSNTIATSIYALPQKKLADDLFELYLVNVNEFLPIVRKDVFMVQYQQCYLGKGIFPGRKWLAVLNMIFAIACAFNRLSGRETVPGFDESIFSARAKSLSLSENVLYEHSDLQQIQAETLMAFLLLTQSQINRSWKIIGIAVRSGIALGLNLEIRIIGLDMKSGEARKQLWWSMFRLESLLSTMTGRASCLGNASSSASPPFLNPDLNLAIPDISQPRNRLQWTIDLGGLDEEQKVYQVSFLKSLEPSQSLYNFYMADLALISHGIINDVNASGTPHLDRSGIESRISFYSESVDFWASAIHPSFSFQDGQITLLARESFFRSSLALNYYSVRILLNRPSLRGLPFDREWNSRCSNAKFAGERALKRLQACLGAIAQFPDQPDLTWYYQIPQWWNILHILTQSTVNLLLDISMDHKLASEPLFPVESAIWAGVKKALCWFHCLGKTSESALRAFRFFSTCIERMAPDKAYDMDCLSPTVGQSESFSDAVRSGYQVKLEANITSPVGDIEGTNDTKSSKWDSNLNEEDAQSSLAAECVSCPGASAVLDTDQNLSDSLLNTDVAVENLLFTLVELNQ